jgi:hypothetical protein
MQLACCIVWLSQLALILFSKRLKLHLGTLTNVVYSWSHTLRCGYNRARARNKYARPAVQIANSDSVSARASRCYFGSRVGYTAVEFCDHAAPLLRKNGTPVPSTTSLTLPAFLPIFVLNRPLV